MQVKPHNIYIHVPFCMSKCNYCAFFSQACVAPDWGKYTTDICDEIKYWANKIGRFDVPTVFFGGGTPSLMPVECFAQIMNTICTHCNLPMGAEITLESNPATIDNEKLNSMRNAGVNRLSIGVQSFDDTRLKFLGRRHSANDARRLIASAQNIGLRVSADFIYGLPQDTVDDVIKTCNQINQIGLAHCSMYELTIEQNTPFGKMNLNMPDNDTMAQMYVAIGDTLKLPRYEVSNYAQGGDECRHNQNVWDGAAYVGIGQGAAGRVYIDDTWYEQRGAYEQFDKINNQTRAIEKVIMGMRTVRGCELTDDVKNVIDIAWINSHPTLVQIDGGRVAATPQGMLVLDDIVEKMVR